MHIFAASLEVQCAQWRVCLTSIGITSVFQDHRNSATSASVERLFSKVGSAFSAKRKSSEAETLENLMFANANL